MRDFEAMCEEINMDILAVAAAKKELKLRTKELVAQMQKDGHDRAWGVAYIDRLCLEVDSLTAHWSRKYFEEEWPATAE